MDSSDPAGQPRESEGGCLLEGYLTALDAELIVGRRGRAAIIAEIADGLSCAVDERRREGLSASAAVAAAVDEFG